jgi:hypothetical protein
MIFDGFEMDNAYMTIKQELQVQGALDSMEVDTVEKETNANDQPSTDSDDGFDVENMVNDEPKN